jgi:hypothetical protein
MVAQLQQQGEPEPEGAGEGSSEYQDLDVVKLAKLHKQIIRAIRTKVKYQACANFSLDSSLIWTLVNGIDCVNAHSACKTLSQTKTIPTCTLRCN